MAGFVKLDAGILKSSLWVGRDARSVFITALLLADAIELTEEAAQINTRDLTPTGWKVPPGWYGFVRAAGSAIILTDGIADSELGFSLLDELGSPDPDSRSTGFGGRRLARIDGGYIVLNYFKYRDRDFGAANRMRRLRDRRRKGQKKPQQPALPPTLGPVYDNPPVAETPPVTANTRNVRPNVTHSRGQSAEGQKVRVQRTTTANSKSVALAKNWLVPYLNCWREAVPEVEDSAIAGTLARYVRPLDKKHGSEKVTAQLRLYLVQVGTQFASAAGFARGFGTWTGKSTNGVKQSKQERGREGLSRYQETGGLHGVRASGGDNAGDVPRALPNPRR